MAAVITYTFVLLKTPGYGVKLKTGYCFFFLSFALLPQNIKLILKKICIYLLLRYRGLKGRRLRKRIEGEGHRERKKESLKGKRRRK